MAKIATISASIRLFVGAALLVTELHDVVRRLLGQAGTGKVRISSTKGNGNMTDQKKKPRRSVTRNVAIVVGMLAVAAIATGAVFYSLYVHDQDIDAASAARELETARGRFVGQAPLLEYAGFKGVIVHRTAGERHALVAVHALVYDATEGVLRRVDVPIGLLRVATIGSRINLGSLGITVDDLERHGPGLVLDTTGGAVATLPAADALIGTHSVDSQILIWTE